MTNWAARLRFRAGAVQSPNSRSFFSLPFLALSSVSLTPYIPPHLLSAQHAERDTLHRHVSGHTLFLPLSLIKSLSSPSTLRVPLTREIVTCIEPPPNFTRVMFTLDDVKSRDNNIYFI